MKNTYDLIVVGGGPAGSLLSCLIAQKGYNVLLIEKEYFPIYKVGESLLPSIQPFLSLVGLKDLWTKSDYVPKPGGTFRWGKEVDLFSFYFGGCGGNDQTASAYQVRRHEFDYQLVQHAVKNGVRLQEGAKVVETIEESGRVIGVIYEAAGQKKKVFAKYVADTSGHKSKLASQVGQRTFSNHYQHVALFGYFNQGETLPEPAAGNTLFEAFSDGWCWYIPLKENLFSVGALITKEKAQKLTKIDKLIALNNCIAQTNHIKKMMAKAVVATEQPYDQLHIRSDYSYCQQQFWKPGLVLVGDSAAFVDVLLSSGVHLATMGAILCARSLLSFFAGKIPEATSFNEYEIRYKKEFGTFYKMLAGFYNQEKDAKTYQQELRYWLAKTSACGMPLAAKEKQLKLIQRFFGTTIDNEKMIKNVRQYIQELLSCDNPQRLLSDFPETPKIQSQLISTTSKTLTWEAIQ